MTCLRNPRVIFPANSNGSAKAAAGIARTDYAGHSFPDGAYFGTHRVSRNAESGLPCSYSTATDLRLRRISCLDFSGTNCKRCDTRARIARKSDPFDVVVWNVVRVNMLLHFTGTPT